MIPEFDRAIADLHGVGLYFQQPGARRMVNAYRTRILIDAIGWLNEQGLCRGTDFFVCQRSRHEPGDSGSVRYDFDFVDGTAAACFKLRWSSYM